MTLMISASCFPRLEHRRLPANNTKHQHAVSMSVGKVMAIVVLFHQSHYRDFKNFYHNFVCHRKPDNFLVNLLAARTAYTFKPSKLAINLKAIRNSVLIPS